MSVITGAEPFAHDGSTEVGVLCSHGFTGSPYSMRPWADHLVEQGYSVRVPLLPGHGTRWQDMNKTAWTDWYGEVDRAFRELAERCTSVYVFGLSMGGTLCLRLAQEHGSRVAGLALVNPSVATFRKDAVLLPYVSKIIPSFPPISNDIRKPGVQEYAYDRLPLRAAASLSKLWTLVRQDLPKITQPLLLLHSAVDHVVEPENSRVILNGVRSTDTTEVVLENSFHVATLDHDAELIFQRSVEFVGRIETSRAGEPV